MRTHFAKTLDFGKLKFGNIMNIKQVVHRVVTGVVLAGWLTLVILAIENRDRITVGLIVDLSPENSFLAALMMLTLFALKSVTVVVWSALLYAASAMLFPLPWALLVNFIGTLIMIVLPYRIGTRADIEKLRKRVENHKHASLTTALKGESTLVFTLLFRTIAFVPADLLSMYCGAERKCFSEYLIGSLIGLLPTLVAFTCMGDALTNPTGAQFLWSAAVQGILTVISVSLYVVLLKKRKKAKQSET